MMRYVLIENAIVRCDDISQYALIDTSSIFQGKDFFEGGNYAPILQILRSFLDKERGAIELVVSTLFYMVPCFVRVLQDSLGNTVKIIPLYELLGEDNLIEIYDHYTIEITNDQGNISCNVYQDDIMAKIRSNNSFNGYVKETSLDTIKAINSCLDNPICPVGNLDEVSDVFSNYDSVLTKKEEFSMFSPFGALKFYDKIIPGIHHLASLNTIRQVEKSIHVSFSISLYPNNVSFERGYNTWVFLEKNKALEFKRTISNNSRSITFTLPESMFEETKLQIPSANLTFCKCYLDIERDVMGQLHMMVQSLDNRVFYKLLQF